MEKAELDFHKEAYDILELGDTKLMFIPFSSEDFSWEKDT